MIGVLKIPKVALEAGVTPNHGTFADVALSSDEVAQVLPEAPFVLTVKSRLPLFPAPGLLKRKYLDTPLVNVPVPLKKPICVSQADKFLK